MYLFLPMDLKELELFNQVYQATVIYARKKGNSALIKDSACWIRSWALLANSLSLSFFSSITRRIKILIKLLNLFNFLFHHI